MRAAELSAVLNKDPRFQEITVEKDQYAKSLSARFLGDPFVSSWTGVGLNIKVTPRYQYLQGILFDIIVRSSTFLSDGKEIPAGRYLIVDAVDLGDCVSLVMEDSHGQISYVKTKKDSEICRNLQGSTKTPQSITEKDICRGQIDF